MSTLMMSRLRRFGIATLMTGLMMSGLTSDRADASIIRPRVEQQMVYYSTSGTLGTPDDPASHFVSFAGISSPTEPDAPAGVFYMPGVFSLGAFQTLAVPTGMTVGFDQFPFSITMNLFGELGEGGIVSTILIQGTLDGELTASPGTGLLASVSSITQVGTPIGTPPFSLDHLQVLAPQFIVPAGRLPSMSTQIHGYVNAQVPEPTALATLGVGLAALMLHRRRRLSRTVSAGPDPGRAA